MNPTRVRRGSPAPAAFPTAGLPIGYWSLVIGHWRLACRWGCSVLLVMWLMSGWSLAADDVFAPPTAADVRTKALQWVAERGVTDKAVLENIGREWVIEGASLTTEEIFQRVLRTLTLADADAKTIVEACREAVPVATWPREVVPLTEAMPDFARQHLRLFVGDRKSVV